MYAYEKELRKDYVISTAKDKLMQKYKFKNESEGSQRERKRGRGGGEGEGGEGVRGLCFPELFAFLIFGNS